MLPSNALSHLCLQVKQWLKPANSLTPLFYFLLRMKAAAQMRMPCAYVSFASGAEYFELCHVSRNPLLDSDTVKCLINFNTPCLRNNCENDQFVNISFILQTGKVRGRKGHWQSLCQKYTAEHSSNSQNTLIMVLFSFRIWSSKETLTIEGRSRRIQNNVYLGIVTRSSSWRCPKEKSKQCKRCGTYLCTQCVHTLRKGNENRTSETKNIHWYV